MLIRYLLFVLCIAYSMSSASQAAANVKKALEHHKNGNFDKALIFYHRALPHVNNELAVTLNNNAGAIYTQLGQYELAKERFEASVAADPSNAKAHFNLAVTLSARLGQHEEALISCRRAIECDPMMHTAYHMLGNILQDLGRNVEAEEYFIRAEHIAQGKRPSAEQGRHLWASLPFWHSEVGSVKDVVVDGTAYTMKCLSMRPLLFEVPTLLSPDECNHIVERATPSLARSHVMGSADDVYRTSENTWLTADAQLQALQRRIAALIGLPELYIRHKSEDLQVVSYTTGGTFKVHHDSAAFHPRLVTILVYLNDVEDGGETWFPGSNKSTVEEAISDAQQYMQECSAEKHLIPPGVKVVPSLGKGIIFINHAPSGELDPAAVHAGLPVIGNKWIANYWIKSDFTFLQQFL